MKKCVKICVILFKMWKCMSELTCQTSVGFLNKAEAANEDKEFFA